MIIKQGLVTNILFVDAVQITKEEWRKHYNESNVTVARHNYNCNPSQGRPIGITVIILGQILLIPVPVTLASVTPDVII